MAIFLANHRKAGSTLSLSFECESWEQAEKQAKKHGMELLGELHDTTAENALETGKPVKRSTKEFYVMTFNVEPATGSLDVAINAARQPTCHDPSDRLSTVLRLAAELVDERAINLSVHPLH